MKQNSDTNFVCNNQMLIWEDGFQSPQQKLPWTNHPQDNFACTKEEAEVHSLEQDVRTCSWVKCRKQGLFPLDSPLLLIILPPSLLIWENHILTNNTETQISHKGPQHYICHFFSECLKNYKDVLLFILFRFLQRTWTEIRYQFV